MRRTTRTRFSWVSLVLIVVFLMASLPASAQEAGQTDLMPIQADGVTEVVGTADMAAPVVEKLEWSDAMPILSPEQQKQLEGSNDRVNLPGPSRKDAEGEAFGAAPDAGSESLLAGDLSEAGDAMRAPGDAQVYRNTNFSDGEEYEYLTDEEKDVEQEIKNTAVSYTHLTLPTSDLV